MELKVLPTRPNGKYMVMPYRVISFCIKGRIVIGIVFKRLLEKKAEWESEKQNKTREKHDAAFFTFIKYYVIKIAAFTGLVRSKADSV